VNQYFWKSESISIHFNPFAGIGHWKSRWRGAFPAILGHLVCAVYAVCAYAHQARSIPGRSDRQSAWGSRSPGSRAPVDSLTHWLLTGLPLTSKSEPSKSCLWYLRYRSYKPGTITMRWPTGAGRFKAWHCRNAHVPMHAIDESVSGARGRAETGPMRWWIFPFRESSPF